MWPIVQQNIKNSEILTGNLGLILIAGFAYAFCQNATKNAEMAVDVTILSTFAFLVPSIFVFWCAATLMCRLLNISDDHIGVAVSQYIVLWISNLFLLVLYNRIAFTLGAPGGWEVWVYGEQCDTHSWNNCKLNWIRMMVASLFASVLSLIIFLFGMRPIFRWMAPKAIQEQFSAYPEFGVNRCAKNVAWISGMFVVLAVMNAFFHFM